MDAAKGYAREKKLLRGIFEQHFKLPKPERRRNIVSQTNKRDVHAVTNLMTKM